MNASQDLQPQQGIYSSETSKFQLYFQVQNLFLGKVFVSETG